MIFAKIFYHYFYTKVAIFELNSTGMCAQNLGITAMDEPLFHFYYKPVSIQCDSDQSQLIAVGHYVDVYRMYRINYGLSKC